ncbi:MAG: metallophosphoesterase [Parvularculaceae bacterium]
MPKPPSDFVPDVSKLAAEASNEADRMLRAFDINPKGRDFVIGDLHGCIAEFETLLRRLKFDFQKDRMFSVGDLVDRGPDSMACLRLLREPWFFAVKGNHEDMMLSAVASNLRVGAENWAWNGGDWGIARFEGGDPEFFDLLDLVDACPFAFTVRSRELGLVGISHAEPPSRWSAPIIEDEVKNVIWRRDKIHAPDRGLAAEGAQFSVHGHCIVGDMVFRDDFRAFWIDLGCYAFGRLCALQISGHEDLWPEPFIVEGRD